MGALGTKRLQRLIPQIADLVIKNLKVSGDLDVEGSAQQQKQDVVIVTEDTTLTAADSGKTIFLGNESHIMGVCGGINLTLPSVAVGLSFTIIINTADCSFAPCFVLSGHGLVGSISNNEGTGYSPHQGGTGASPGNTKIKFIGGHGCRVELVSDGNQWYVKGSYTDVSAPTTFES